MHILYFASLREKAGLASEEVAPPAEVADVDALVAWLRDRGGKPAEALADLRFVRVAVNQEHVSLRHPVRAGDEVAFFPPVTGGTNG
ncbi:MAG: molybdopterin converting factor subunit 1 [Rhodospirillales bacterium]|nr:MAG: molybdopterin converting factor subunit 1 [Rhodospirillales bacterium]